MESAVKKQKFAAGVASPGVPSTMSSPWHAPRRRPDTINAHRKAVERVIACMRERFGEPLTLADMADVAYMSPFHFDHVFREITGIPPGMFLSALRLEKAKQLLLTTSLSVTDICFEVGYNSLGTFVTRFTQLVGASPRALRDAARDGACREANSRAGARQSTKPERVSGPCVYGEVRAANDSTGMVFVGMFEKPIPQGRPIAGMLLASPGLYWLAIPASGRYSVFAAAQRKHTRIWDSLASGNSTLSVGCGDLEVDVQSSADFRVDISLRPLATTDPPLLIALPLLM